MPDGKTFRFAPLLKIREQTRDEIRKELTLLEERRLSYLESLRRLDEELQRHCQKWRNAQNDASPNPQLLAQFGQTQNRLTERKKEQENLLKELEGTIQSVHLQFEEAVKEVRILENLRERKEEEARVEQLKKEQKQLEERR